MAKLTMISGVRGGGCESIIANQTIGPCASSAVACARLINLLLSSMLLSDGATGRGCRRPALSALVLKSLATMPVNAKLALDHTLGNWTNTVELQLVGGKDEVSQVHNELTTAAYALLNLCTDYQWQNVRGDVGIDNVFDKFYYLPLGVDHGKVYGYNVPGQGRSFSRP